MRRVFFLTGILAALSCYLCAQPPVSKDGCRYVEDDKPSLFISYVREGVVKTYKGTSVRKVFLRLHNNSTCDIHVETPDNTGDETLFKYGTETLPNGRTITGLLQHPQKKDFDLEIFYDVKESEAKGWKPANYWDDRDLVFKYSIPSGYTAVFPVDERFFRRKQRISILFGYDWEDDSDQLRTFGTITHRVTYVYDIPKGYFKEGEGSTAYPTTWFGPINDPNKPDWEILPQEAKAGEVILSKRNELGILSNFAATPFELDGKRYASVEGFWQMMLYPEGPDDERAKDKSITWKTTREQVAQMTAFEAKQAGTLAEENMKKLGIDWCSYNGKHFPYRSATPGEHYRLILAAMRAKLEQNPEVKRILLATGDLILKPDHHGEENPPPEWKYYEIWMQLRSEMQKPAR